ncbi:lipopolysaccharide export system permease protein [Planktotalea frisia]|uniref:Putative permease YjgP/YjgQ family protein n=1 Tax=Planktotalea frisia TaxID=696762 RepID=A0A1L9NV10_9RHOB|nr:putative permease YjgP/YjgQ family protein [Planktotalea frisia]PZX34826.1 lipopolysaccharide export system permease protein [Planktotalea frisia]
MEKSSRQTGAVLARFDRYVLSQLFVLFGFFSLVLVSVYWINRAVILFDRLIADGQPASVFLEFTALSLPNVVRMVLPMSAFAASVYVTNRLASESELVVMQATGYSPWRLARPVVIFGLIVGTFMMVLTQYLVPTSLEQLRFRENEISGTLSAKLLREGEFMNPSEGVTFYIREITPEGVLKDVFLSDRRNADRATTYSSVDGFLVNEPTGPKLVVVNGIAQALNTETRKLTKTKFTDFAYNISDLIDAPGALFKPLDQRSTAELYFATDLVSKATAQTPGRILEEVHGRFNQPILCVVAALIGFSTLLVGGFSRFGVGRQIIGAILLLVLVKLVESIVTDPIRANANLWPLVYAQSVFGLGVSILMLRLAARPRRRRKDASLSEARA